MNISYRDLKSATPLTTRAWYWVEHASGLFNNMRFAEFWVYISKLEGFAVQHPVIPVGMELARTHT